MIRRPTIHDAEEIATVHHTSWHATYSDLLSPETNARKTLSHFVEKWQTILSSGHEERLNVAEGDDGRIQGFVSVGPDRSSDAGLGEIWAIYIDPSAFGSGIGAALFDAGLADLRKMGYEEAMIRVERGNLRAIRFYQRRGFSEDSCAPKGCDIECEDDVAYRGRII